MGSSLIRRDIRRRNVCTGKSKRSVLVVCCLCVVIIGCVTESKEAAKRDVTGPYKTWDEVISRWIGGRTSDLYVELGPPNLHPHELDNGMTEMA